MRDPNGESAHRTASPSAWVKRFIDGVPAGGSVLDVACGSGRHVALALGMGRLVTGVDRDTSAAEAAFGRNQAVTLMQRDLEDGGAFPFDPQSFAGIIVTNYLWRPILPAIVAAVAADGVLIYETFMAAQERFGRPRNPEFLLRPGELLEAVAPMLRVVAFEHARISAPDRVVQRIVAVGLDHRWPGTDAPAA